MGQRYEAIELQGPGGSRLRCALVPWDAELLGHPVGVVLGLEGVETAGAEAPALPALLERYEAWCAAEGIRFSSLRLPAEAHGAIAAVQVAGFRYVEQVLHPTLELTASAPPDDERVRPARRDELETLREIARRSFSGQRLHADPAVPDRLANDRYAAWVERSGSDPEDAFLVVTDEGRARGFWLYRADGEAVHLALTAIEPEAQGRGLGRLLWTAGTRLLASRGVRRLTTTVSAGNVRVLNLYARLGWRFGHPEVTFHRWHQPPPAASERV